MCLIAIRGAKDFLRGDPLEFNSLDDHHMFPKSKARVYGANSEINSIVNKTLIEENTNRKYVKDKPPSQVSQENNGGPENKPEHVNRKTSDPFHHSQGC